MRISLFFQYEIFYEKLKKTHIEAVQKQTWLDNSIHYSLSRIFWQLQSSKQNQESETWKFPRETRPNARSQFLHDTVNTMNPNNKAKQVRKASPPRQESEDTFRKKLEEIKRQRLKQSSEPKTKVIVNGKPALEVQGDWALFFSASKNKKYYFNLKTLVNQWTKPEGWIGGEEVRKIVMFSFPGFIERKVQSRIWRVFIFRIFFCENWKIQSCIWCFFISRIFLVKRSKLILTCFHLADFLDSKQILPLIFCRMPS